MFPSPFRIEDKTQGVMTITTSQHLFNFDTGQTCLRPQNAPHSPLHWYIPLDYPIPNLYIRMLPFLLIHEAFNSRRSAGNLLTLCCCSGWFFFQRSSIFFFFFLCGAQVATLAISLASLLLSLIDLQDPLLLLLVTLAPASAFTSWLLSHPILKGFNFTLITLLIHWFSPFLSPLNSDHLHFSSNHSHEGKNNCILISLSPQTEMLSLLPQLSILSPDTHWLW